MLENKRKFVMANQLLKCGTSIGANVNEAQHAESKDGLPAYRQGHGVHAPAGQVLQGAVRRAGRQGRP